MRLSEHSKIFFRLLFLAHTLYACREPFYPEIRKYENILTIEATLTNEFTTHRVLLSRSVAYSEVKVEPELSAVVEIESKTGESFLFREIGAGNYVSVDKFAGEVGQSYRLHIITTDGNEYLSDYEEILPPIPFTLDHEFTSDHESVRQPGVQLLVSTRVALNSSCYYRWDVEETWEYIVPFRGISIDFPYRCWRTMKSQGIYIESAERFGESGLINYPFYFLNLESNKLYIRYCATIKQNRISRAAFDYWKRTKDSKNNVGSLYDPIPGQNIGNIHNVQAPNELVLGFFQVSGISSNREFISRNEIPSAYSVSNGFDYCKQTIVARGRTMQVLLDEGWIVTEDYFSIEAGETLFILVNYYNCIDCTAEGSASPPIFWVAGAESL